jgi:hypothetical protein
LERALGYVFRNIELLDPEEPVEGLPQNPNSRIRSHTFSTRTRTPTVPSQTHRVRTATRNRIRYCVATCTALTCFPEEFQFFDDEALLTSLSDDALHKIFHPKSDFGRLYAQAANVVLRTPHNTVYGCTEPHTVPSRLRFMVTVYGHPVTVLVPLSYGHTAYTVRRTVMLAATSVTYHLGETNMYKLGRDITCPASH